MAVSLVSTGVQFPDSTIQTTAATAGPAPGMVYLSQVSASNSATVDVEHAFDSTYSTYVIIVSDMYFSTANIEVRARMKIGGAYVTASSYQIVMVDNPSAGGSWSGFATTASSSLFLGRYVGTTAAGYPYSLTMTIPNPSSTATRKMIYGEGAYFDQTPIFVSNGFYGGYVASTAALTGIRFYASTGNITGGTFRLYGIKAS